MGAVLLYCRQCWSGLASLGEVPLKCPRCDRITTWTTVSFVPDPAVPYVLNYFDKRFLASIRVQVDDDAVK